MLVLLDHLIFMGHHATINVSLIGLNQGFPRCGASTVKSAQAATRGCTRRKNVMDFFFPHNKVV